MKIRCGFVSNSSSSSFAISAKDERVKVMMEVDISQLVDEVISTQKSLDRYIIDGYGYGSNSLEKILFDYESVKEFYDNASREIAKGKKVLICRVSNEDSDPISEFIYNNGAKLLRFSSDVVVLQDQVC